MDTVRDFFTAKKSRTISSLSVRDEQRWVAGRVGYMLVKSLDMSNKVHDAMISRGFNGDVKLLHDYAVRKRDYAAIATMLMFSSVLALISQNIIRI